MSNGLRMTKTESMGKYNVGDIYSVRVEFEDDPTQAKIRPVVILYVEEAESPFVALVQPITSKPPDVRQSTMTDLKSRYSNGVLRDCGSPPGLSQMSYCRWRQKRLDDSSDTWKRKTFSAF